MANTKEFLTHPVGKKSRPISPCTEVARHSTQDGSLDVLKTKRYGEWQDLVRWLLKLLALSNFLVLRGESRLGDSRILRLSPSGWISQLTQRALRHFDQLAGVD